METLMYQILIVTSFLSFLFYAIGALTMTSMKLEFERYGLERFRIPIACLQLAAVIGLLIGNWFPIIGFLAAGGLTLQMLLAVMVRIKIKDAFFRSLPAVGYLLINGSLTYFFFQAR
jgi:hypothetical protein